MVVVVMNKSVLVANIVSCLMGVEGFTDALIVPIRSLCEVEEKKAALLILVSSTYNGTHPGETDLATRNLFSVLKAFMTQEEAIAHAQYLKTKRIFFPDAVKLDKRALHAVRDFIDSVESFDVYIQREITSIYLNAYKDNCEHDDKDCQLETIIAWTKKLKDLNTKIKKLKIYDEDPLETLLK
jgi:hypothetical protein